MLLLARLAHPNVARALAALVAALAWSALALQYLLLLALTRDGIGPLLATLRFVSFFTVLSNLLVALTTSCVLIGTGSALGGFLASARVRGLAALCIGITSGIYHFLLAATWAPQGLQRLADVALHYLVPALYLLWWIACAAHGRLQWRDAMRWLAFPLGFLVWVLARGAWLHEYPYPFLDVDALGLGRVCGNALVLGALFLCAGWLLIAFDRRVRRSP